MKFFREYTYRIVHRWARKRGLAIVNQKHLENVYKDIRRLRRGVCLPDLSAFGKEDCEILPPK